MPVDIGAHFRAAEDTAALATSPALSGLKGSSILAIAGEVRSLRKEGKQVYDLTIGDFDPKIFPIPDALRRGIQRALDRGETSYPPAVGMQALREGVVALYRRELDLEVPVDAVLVGSGARPPLYAAFQAIVAAGDTVVYPVPSWNINHYVALSKARGIEIVTSPDTGFMPTADQLAPHLADARMVVVNSPQNPSGTVISEVALGEICDLILAENERRRRIGSRPLFLLYDAVYWQLTFGGAVHHTPYSVRPAIAPYTIMIDAISKSWSATGLRVGWCVAPPWVRAKMQALIGHIGAWAGRAEQVATAEILQDPSLLGDHMNHFKRQVQERLALLQGGIEDMARDGLPVRCLEGKGAIYLSVRLDVVGRTTLDGTVLADDEAVRAWMLKEGGVAVVPFSAFGYPDGSGWMRLSVGSVSVADAEATLASIRNLLMTFA